MLSSSDSRASAISLRRVVYFLGGFEDFRGLGFSARKDCIVSYEEKETGRKGQTWALCMRGRNKVKEGKVLRPDLDWPPAAIHAKTKGEGHVTSWIGNGRTAAMVH